MNDFFEINFEDSQYPQRLLKIKRFPKKLYVLGNVELLNSDSIAMVGTRDLTSYGEFYASKFAEELSNCGITIVSGLATRN